MTTFFICINIVLTLCFTYLFQRYLGNVLLDVLPGKKIPTIKTLQAEYQTLLFDKKKAWAEYIPARKAMRELVMAKSNIDRLLCNAPERITRGQVPCTLLLPTGIAIDSREQNEYTY